MFANISSGRRPIGVREFSTRLRASVSCSFSKRARAKHWLRISSSFPTVYSLMSRAPRCRPLSRRFEFFLKSTEFQCYSRPPISQLEGCLARLRVTRRYSKLKRAKEGADPRMCGHRYPNDRLFGFEVETKERNGNVRLLQVRHFSVFVASIRRVASRPRIDVGSMPSHAEMRGLMRAIELRIATSDPETGSIPFGLGDGRT